MAREYSVPLRVVKSESKISAIFVADADGVVDLERRSCIADEPVCAAVMMACTAFSAEIGGDDFELDLRRRSTDTREKAYRPSSPQRRPAPSAMARSSSRRSTTPSASATKIAEILLSDFTTRRGNYIL